LTNHDLAGQAAANASTCFGRLGEYTNQIEWSSRALDNLHGSMVGGHVVQAVRNKAMGLAMLGRDSESNDAIHSVEAIAMQHGGWIEQAFYLYCADVHMLMNKAAEAFKWGRRGSDGSNRNLTFDALAGPYSRWVAIDAFRGPASEQHAVAMEGLVSRLDEFDALDQIEIIISNAIVARARGQRVDGSGSGLRQRMEAMPAAVSIQLQRLYPLPLSGLLT
jgi:hypothetical protein